MSTVTLTHAIQYRTVRPGVYEGYVLGTSGHYVDREWTTILRNNPVDALEDARQLLAQRLRVIAEVQRRRPVTP
jgi:hypothetical protein